MPSSLAFVALIISLAAVSASEGSVRSIACEDSLQVLCHPYKEAMCGMLRNERIAIMLAHLDQVVSRLQGWDKSNKASWLGEIKKFENLFELNKKQEETKAKAVKSLMQRSVKEELQKLTGAKAQKVKPVVADPTESATVAVPASDSVDEEADSLSHEAEEEEKDVEGSDESESDETNDGEDEDAGVDESAGDDVESDDDGDDFEIDVEFPFLKKKAKVQKAPAGHENDAVVRGKDARSSKAGVKEEHQVRDGKLIVLLKIPKKAVRVEDVQLGAQAKAKFFKKLFRKVKSGFSKVGSAVKKVANKAGSSIKSVANKAGSSIKSVATKAGNSIKNAATTAGGAIANAAKKVGNAVETAAAKTKSGFEKGWKEFKHGMEHYVFEEGMKKYIFKIGLKEYLYEIGLRDNVYEKGLKVAGNFVYYNALLPLANLFNSPSIGAELPRIVANVSDILGPYLPCAQKGVALLERACAEKNNGKSCTFCMQKTLCSPNMCSKFLSSEMLYQLKLASEMQACVFKTTPKTSSDYYKMISKCNLVVGISSLISSWNCSPLEQIAIVLED